MACSVCGVEVPRKPGPGRPRKLCDGCEAKRLPGLAEERPCAECGVLFRPRQRTGKFCRKACEKRARNRGYRRTQVGGPYRLLFIRERGERCEYCGFPFAAAQLELDHVVEIVNGGEMADPANVRVVCRPCYLARHGRGVVGSPVPSVDFVRASRPLVSSAQAKAAVRPIPKK